MENQSTEEKKGGKCGGDYKHLVLGKFTQETTQQEIDDLIKGYANLVSLVPPMISFRWGKDVSQENLNQGYTYIFESTFDSTEDIAEYVAHPAHVEYANKLLPKLEKVIIVDYKPVAVHP
ncbi:hypothetical protein DCAR_0102636 [Daucus carota subsp. sativus]|uniref:Stress-response A/B barrel domain-containing protein n=1 Tax=Daucus carota subsp. sativus TaxID=79200 RepID=A0AAF1AKE3_DAUCS|nr:PREDICTED: stress-response A/B barrel domain-containing protein HS1-like [Daucus carota subsp. sativus]XP_017229201.1 PREDICTED: stress-response A/B barrel domain-containing protein HS1-like [Daucus carota subsp. sativus]WOG83460.1 hypothetical protein DCAR_0102635 [Daucus carota subsp. sativus]WOG83461.1 hypothetical protein DCAR_0102636 [Daucus carota subsp. sativus]